MQEVIGLHGVAVSITSDRGEVCLPILEKFTEGHEH